MLEQRTYTGIEAGAADAPTAVHLSSLELTLYDSHLLGLWAGHHPETGISLQLHSDLVLGCQLSAAELLRLIIGHHHWLLQPQLLAPAPPSHTHWPNSSMRAV